MEEDSQPQEVVTEVNRNEKDPCEEAASLLPRPSLLSLGCVQTLLSLEENLSHMFLIHFCLTHPNPVLKEAIGWATKL